MIVLDSSFFLAAVLPDPRSVFARRLLTTRTGEFVGPSLLAFEVANVLIRNRQKGLITAADQAAALRIFVGQDVALDRPPDPAVMDQIAALADAHALSGYDAAFLEAAVRRRAELATLDEDLADAGRRCGLVVHHT